MCKLFALDRNTWYHITVCKLFALGRNTWYHITVCKLFALDRNTWYHITVCKLFVFDRNTWYHMSSLHPICCQWSWIHTNHPVESICTWLHGGETVIHITNYSTLRLFGAIQINPWPATSLQTEFSSEIYTDFYIIFTTELSELRKKIMLKIYIYIPIDVCICNLQFSWMDS